MSLFIVLSLFVFLVSIYTCKMDFLSKVFISIFVAIWHVCIWGALISEGLFYKLHISSVLLLWGGVLMFMIGFRIRPISKSVYLNSRLDNLDVRVGSFLENKAVRLIIIAFAVYMTVCFLRFFTTLQIAQTAAEIRGEYFDPTSELYGSLFHLLNTYFFKPGVVVLSGLMCYSLLRRRNVQCYIILVALLAYHTLGAGRFGYVQMFISVIIVWALYKRRINKTEFRVKRKRTLWLVLFLVFLGYVCLALVSGLRIEGYKGSIYNSFVEGVIVLNMHMQTYLFGPIVAFDQGIIDGQFINSIGGYMNGQYFLNPLFNILSLFQKLTGQAAMELPIAQVAKAQQDTNIVIGHEVSINALYTWNIAYYVDFGVIGVLLMNFFIGMWIRSVFKMFYKKPTISAFLLICQIVQVCFFSTFNSSWYSLMTFVLIVILYWTHKKERMIKISGIPTKKINYSSIHVNII